MSDGRQRCGWGGSAEDYIPYHDAEWGRPVTDDSRLFEKICLEGFQSGLSWITILRKREHFRKAFKGFDIDKVAKMGEADVERLLQDAGIVRHRGKIASTINNAKRAQELRKEDLFGAITQWRGKNPNAAIILKGDKAASFGPVADLMDALAASKTLRFNLMTDLKTRKPASERGK